MDQSSKIRSISLEDIRYFECEGLVDDGVYHHYTDKLFHVPTQAVARANRLATLCYRAKVSITTRSLYLCFTPALQDGIVVPTDFRREVWQRYVMYGLPLSFNQLDEESKTKRVWLATLASLRKIVPSEQMIALEEAASTVEAGGEDLQFSLASAKTKNYFLELAYTIPTWPNIARLSLTLTDRASLAKSSCILFESKDSNESGFLGGKVKVDEGTIRVSPKKSSWGTFYARRNNVSSFVLQIESLLRGTVSVARNPYEE
jgi:hypothetical protein